MPPPPPPPKKETRRIDIRGPLVSIIIIILFLLVIYTIKPLNFLTGRAISNIKQEVIPIEEEYDLPKHPFPWDEVVNNSYIINGYTLKRYVSNKCFQSDGDWVRIEITTVCTNSEGFRDKNHSLVKDSNTIRIAVIGDSYVFGWGVEENETFVMLLEKKINKEYANTGKRFEVFNFGFGGAGLKDKVLYYTEFAKKYDQDIIIIVYLWDDFVDWTGLQNIKEELARNFTNKHPEITFEEAMKIVSPESISLFCNKESRKPERWYYDEFDKQLEYLYSTGKKPEIFIFDLYSSPEQEFSLLELQEKYNFTYRKFIRPIGVNIDLHEKDTHFNKFGNEVCAEQLFEMLVPYIEEKLSE